MTNKIFKRELSFKNFENKDCMILNVQYRLCFTEVCGGIFDKNSFILGAKLNVLKNFLLRAEREVQFPLGTPFLLCSQHAQSFIEKSPVLRIS